MTLPPDDLIDKSPQEQVDWFDANDLGAMPHKFWAMYYVVTVLHKGLHCVSCLEEQEHGYMDVDDYAEWCCCQATREQETSEPGPTS